MTATTTKGSATKKRTKLKRVRKKKVVPSKTKRAPAATANGNGATMAAPAKKDTPASILGLRDPDQKVPTKVRKEAPPQNNKINKLRFKVKSDKVITFDKKEAEAYINLPTLDAERDITDGHVQTLLDEMLAGTFNGSNVVVASAILAGTEYKLNAQHTAWGVFLHPKSGFCLEHVRRIVYTVANETQLRLLYDTFDRGKSRSDAHCLSVIMIGKPQFVTVQKSSWPKLHQAWKFYKAPGKDAQSRYTIHMVAADMCADENLLLAVAKFLQTSAKGNKDITRQPVLAAMFATFSKRRKAASEFWTAVSDGLGLTAKSDARWRLRDLLSKAVIENKASDEKTAYSAEQLYRICIQAWNRYQAGEKVQSLRPTKTRVAPR